MGTGIVSGPMNDCNTIVLSSSAYLSGDSLYACVSFWDGRIISTYFYDVELNRSNTKFVWFIAWQGSDIFTGRSWYILCWFFCIYHHPNLFVLASQEALSLELDPASLLSLTLSDLLSNCSSWEDALLQVVENSCCFKQMSIAKTSKPQMFFLKYH